MKKIFMLLTAVMMTVAVNAQRIGVWYGVGFNDLTGYGSASKMYVSPVNMGVTYTQEVNTFDFMGGLSVRQKGSDIKTEEDVWKNTSAQLDVDAIWNFIKTDNFKIGVLTGPYLSIFTDKISDTYDFDWKDVDFGWVAGIQGVYKQFTFGANYEFGVIKMNGSLPDNRNTGFIVKVGYQL